MSSDSDSKGISCPPTNPQLENFSLELGIQVAWGEMDALGHVNNVIYFRYLEDARLAYFWKLGFKNREAYQNVSNLFSESGIGPILYSTSCTFKKPLTYPDTIYVGAKVSEMGVKRFNIEHRIVSEGQDAIAAEGIAKVGTYNYKEKKAVEIPQKLKKKIEDLEGREFDQNPEKI